MMDRFNLACQLAQGILSNRPIAPNSLAELAFKAADEMFKMHAEQQKVEGPLEPRVEEKKIVLSGRRKKS